MKFNPQNPPRRFEVGNRLRFELQDCGTAHLNPDEQITFVTEQGGQYDVVRKDWGFYATPSLNGRLAQYGLRGALVVNQASRRYYVLLVEDGKEQLFAAYCSQEGLQVVAWLDKAETIETMLGQSSGS
ncbi:MAG: hypothetical protein WBB60_14560 [Nitrospira sp.]|jgi:hypothetical protein|nr:hypothetical protein [Nitrospira sp.]HQY58614.1 hypothetical protein [Nitrospira sp.]HRA95490.1 hypothetical protein [Nitrospira sp.]